MMTKDRLSKLFFYRSIGPDRYLVIDIIEDEIEGLTLGYHLFDVDEDRWAHVAYLGEREGAGRFEAIIELIEERAY